MKNMHPLTPSWQRAWAAIGARGDGAAVFTQLLARYSEAHRHYHTLQHLTECLGHFEAAAVRVNRTGELEMALWFHDAVYELRALDNEQRSADWAQTALRSAGVPTAAAARVHALVLITRHDALPQLPDEQLLVDIDLSILGAPPERFAQYERQIRQEYSWVPEALFKSKRREILAMFLARQPMYNTIYFQNRLGAQARENLGGALLQLG